MRVVTWFRCVPLLLSSVAASAPAQVPKPAAADDAALVARARAIHARLLTLDTHKDISPQLAPEQLPSDPAAAERYRRQFDPTVRGDCQVDFPKMREGNFCCAFFIVYVGQGHNDAAGFHRALGEANAKFDAIHRMVRLYPDQIGLATSPDEVEALHEQGKLIACIGIENGYCMGEDLSLIEKFHARGARYMSLAHNGHSQLGDSHTPAEPLHGGLTDLGRKAIAELNRVGIMVDVSHASRATMMQAVACSAAPVVASHSGARAVNDHTRNLDDEQLRAMRDSGGVVQCVALADFVKSNPEHEKAVQKLRDELGLGTPGAGAGAAGGQDGEAKPADFDARMQQFRERRKAIDAKYPRANVHDFVDHIDHLVQVMGIEHVGIGTDFDGGGGIDGFDNASEAPNVTIELVRRGYTEEQIARIWSGNLLAVWRKVEAKSKELQAAK
jgi:membrane dipeptidase